MAIFKKGTKMYSILNLKCPRCHEGDLFKTGNWSFKDISEMPNHCPNCKLNYMPEPGFYYGAMFISYIFWGFFCIIVGGVGILGLGLTINQAMLLLILISTISYVWLFRTSRAIWFNIAQKYDPNLKKMRVE